MVSVRYYTDPVCPWSWAAEPWVRKLMVQFGDGLRWSFVMGGLARDFLEGERSGASRDRARQVYDRLIRRWLEVADEAKMPLDPLLWVESPITTSYPACMAVKAAAEQAGDGYRYLRRLREGLMCERRKLDHAEALVEEARAAGLDVERFRIDLRSHAITEAFGSDLAEVGNVPEEASGSDDRNCSRAAGGMPLPSMMFSGGDGTRHGVFGFQSYEAYRDAAMAAGARPAVEEPLSVEGAIQRFGRVTTREVEVLCELPTPRAGAELFRLAEQWKLRPLWRMTGYLWEPVSG